MIHTYGVARAPVPLPATRGVDGAALRTVGADRLAAIVSDHAEHPRPTATRLLEHERVLQALLPHGVVPARYGPAVPDDEALSRLLASRADQLGRLLERVRGRLEMGVRMGLPTAPAAQAPGTGRGYLLDKLHRERQAIRLADELDLALGRLVVRRKVLATREELRLAYLVEANRVGAFRARVEALRAERAGGLACTGPWPAYSFVTEE